jgi:hypothetical protein
MSEGWAHFKVARRRHGYLTKPILRAFAYAAAVGGDPLPALAQEAEMLRHPSGGGGRDILKEWPCTHRR